MIWNSNHVNLRKGNFRGVAMCRCDDLEFARLLQGLTRGEKQAFLEVIKLISRKGIERPKSSKSL